MTTSKEISAPQGFLARIYSLIISVPVRIKVAGIVIFPVLLMSLALNYWVRTGLSDWLSYLLTDERVEIAMAAGSRSVMLVSVLVAAISIFLMTFLMYVVTQPLLELRRAATKVAQGETDWRARVWSHDEIGQLAVSMNSMIDNLVASQEGLEQRNLQLEALNRISMAATQEKDIHDVLYRALQIILEILDLDMGWVYLYDGERAKFHLASWAGVSREMEPVLLDCGSDGLCDCQELLVGNGLPNDAFQVKCKRLQNFGIKRHTIVALQTGEQPLGATLLVSTSDRELQKEELQLLDLVGAQISEIVSNAWLEMKLTDKERTRQRLLQALVKAQEDERSRLARELHDGAGQTLTSLMVRMKALEKQAKDGGMQRKLKGLGDQVSATIEYVRMLSHQMRPAVLDEIGLEKAISNLVETITAESKVDCSLDMDLEGLNLPAEIEATVYRVIQESLTNVMRHAEANEMRVCLRRHNGFLLFEVEDNGRGFNEEETARKPNARSVGIQGMRERVELLEGKLTVSSEVGQGTLISGELPILEEAGRWEKT